MNIAKLARRESSCTPDEISSDLQSLLDGAQRHGQESEPDHEIGDLQQLLIACWDELPRAARRKIAADFAHLKDW